MRVLTAFKLKDWILTLSAKLLTPQDDAWHVVLAPSWGGNNLALNLQTSFNFSLSFHLHFYTYMFLYAFISWLYMHVILCLGTLHTPNDKLLKLSCQVALGIFCLLSNFKCLGLMKDVKNGEVNKDNKNVWSHYLNLKSLTGLNTCLHTWLYLYLGYEEVFLH